MRYIIYETFEFHVHQGSTLCYLSKFNISILNYGFYLRGKLDPLNILLEIETINGAYSLIFLMGPKFRNGGPSWKSM
jgi:hypothetical protein